MFVHRPLPGVAEREATDAAYAVANELRRLLALPAPDPPLVIDPDLRPEGRQGPLVRTLASYAAYYARWSSPWEAQALLRARFSAGDAELGAARSCAWIDPLRYPEGGITDDGRAARSAGSRRAWRPNGCRAAPTPRCTPSSAPAGCPTSSGWPSSCSSATPARLPSLRTTRTLEALRAAVEEGLLDAGDATVLAEAWRFASRIRDAIMLVTGPRRATACPADVRERALIARRPRLPARRLGGLPRRLPPRHPPRPRRSWSASSTAPDL